MKPSEKIRVSIPASGAAQALTAAVKAQLKARRNAAVLRCLQVLKRQPRHVETVQTLALLYLQGGQLDQALKFMDMALRFEPDRAGLHCNRGTVLEALGRIDEAMASFARALQLAPSMAEAHFNRGRLLEQQGQPQAAMASHATALTHRPDMHDARLRLATLLLAGGQAESALAEYELLLAARPNDADAWSNRAAALLTLGRAAQALESADRAIALQADLAEAHGNRGRSQMDLGRLADAIESFDRALAIRPDIATAQWNKGLALLQAGHFEQGWSLYEWRFKLEATAGADRSGRPPRWNGGDPLAGRSLLLTSEQGLGDAIQFSRYATLAAEAGAQVVLQVPQSLVSLLAGVAGVRHCVGMDGQLPSVDLESPLMSLPLAFGTRLDTIPGSQGYLKAPALNRARWEQRLGPKARPRIGLQWAGGSVSRIRGRSLPLAQLMPLLDARYEWISLQKDVPASDRPILHNAGALLQFGDEQADFADAAALCELVDLVISVDTSIAHLAGALARPTWVLLPCHADWRWLQDRDDSPWYASMKLYRQTTDGDWEGVLQRVAADLRATLG